MVLSKDMKKAVVFGLIMGAILSLSNLCFGAEIESLTPSVLRDARYTTHEIQSYSGSNLYYVQVEPGYKYTFNNLATGTKIVGFSEIMEIGATVFDVAQISSGTTYSFNGSQYGYLFFGSSGLGNPAGYFTRIKLNGAEDFIDNLAYALSIGNLSSIWALVVPILAISVLLGLGFYLLKRLLNKIKRAKGGA